MEPLFHTISVVSAAAASGLFSAVWQGAVLVACAVLCLRLLPGLSAAARSAVWMLLFFLMALLPVLPVMVEHDAVLGPVHGPPLHLDLRWSVAIAGLWAVLSLWKGAQLVLAAVRLHRMAGRAIAIQPDAATQALLNGERPAELCISSEVERPSVFGFLRPRILLPPGLVERLSTAELQQVVLHEMEHLRRADDWTNLLQKVGLVLFPLNPVLLWVERRLCAERELACDDRVVRSNCGRKAYAVCLTRLAEFSMLHRGVSLVLGAWDRRPELVRRVHRVLRRPDESLSGGRGALVAAGLVLGLTGGALALARSPQLVGFVAPVQFAAQPGAPVRVAPAAGLREVALRTPEEPVKLVKANLPRTRVQTPSRPRQLRAVAANQMAMNRDVSEQQAQGSQRLASENVDQRDWVVLTEWRSDEPSAHVVFAVATDNRPSYAAVQFANGWLIVQI